MQFKKTKTYTNLARSFAGECQAGMRYQLIAKQAVALEYPVLADMVRKTAKNETYHAKAFYDTLILKAGNSANIELDAGYPFQFGTLEENLAFAAQNECSEHTDIYPIFAQEAKDEGFDDIAALYHRVAQVEQKHEKLFQFLHSALKEGVLYKRAQPTLWVCSECGYSAITKEAWKVCPLCKAKQGAVEIPLPYED